MRMEAPLANEDLASQLPALHLLQNLGFTYLTPKQTMQLRGGKRRNVILEEVLADWLRTHNKIRYKGAELAFSEANIEAAIRALTEIGYDGLVRTSEKVYDLLCLGKSLPQIIQGDNRSFTLRYVDWGDWEQNVYHVTEEFTVDRRGNADSYRVDVVLFVNGIPFVVIECKRPQIQGKDSLPQAIQQQIRSQKEEGIPHLFQYVQLLLAVNKNSAKYATTSTPERFWAVWREDALDEAAVQTAVNKPLDPAETDALLAHRSSALRQNFAELIAGPREVTEQDRAMYSLCRPERLLELVYQFIVYDAGEKKIARYQQYFCVQETLERIKSTRDERGVRRGGVVWHTQGSGKSLTMVMLAKAIALEKEIINPKLLLVTDRTDLDDQIYTTFHHCGRDVVQAKSGRHLAELLQDASAMIVTTVIDKFETALSALPQALDSENIFILVDESHRGQYGQMHARMRMALPRACYLGFTGTPVMKRDKNTLQRFGGFIHVYNIRQAAEDKAVVKLLYEGRHVRQTVYEPIDTWFGALTEDLSGEQVADLKQKFSTADQLNKAEQRIKLIAFDISRHFKKAWKGTGFKAQLVAPDKATALLYHHYLEEFGMVSSSVLISAPDEREGETDIYEESRAEVNKFWAAMMQKYGNEVQYNRQVIQAFKNAEEPEIIIVVDKLLTGFDAPRNTVLYLCRRLKEHTLLQAIARVNRLYEGKEFGYILDYRGVLSELNKALDIYAALPEFEREDLDAYAATMIDVSLEAAKLPQHHSDLWDVFKGLANRADLEAYEQLLGDKALRNTFYERLTLFARTLAIALSSEQFLRETEPKRVNSYQEDLKFFEQLRSTVRLRYAERIDYRQYEPRIRKLIDEYVGADAIEQITEPVSIFDQSAFQAEVDRLKGSAAKADTIAHRALKTCEERLQEDPVFYGRFSELLEQAINAFRETRLAEEYLRSVTQIQRQIVHRTDEKIPAALRHRDVAKAYYGCVHEVLAPLMGVKVDPRTVAADIALAIDDMIMRLRIVNWTTNPDVKNQMRIEMDDLLFDAKQQYGITIPVAQIDEIIEKCLNVAMVRIP